MHRCIPPARRRFVFRNQNKKRRDGDARQHVDGGRDHVAPIVFRPPCVRRLRLEPVKNHSHPEPTRENRDDTGNHAGHKGH